MNGGCVLFTGAAVVVVCDEHAVLVPAHVTVAPFQPEVVPLVLLPIPVSRILVVFHLATFAGVGFERVWIGFIARRVGGHVQPKFQDAPLAVTGLVAVNAHEALVRIRFDVVAVAVVVAVVVHAEEMALVRVAELGLVRVPAANVELDVALRDGTHVVLDVVPGRGGFPAFFGENATVLLALRRSVRERVVDVRGKDFSGAEKQQNGKQGREQFVATLHVASFVGVLTHSRALSRGRNLSESGTLNRPDPRVRSPGCADFQQGPCLNYGTAGC